MSRPDVSRPDPPHFEAPWQAQAFALAVAASDAGVFTWSEWAEEFGKRRDVRKAKSDGSDYFDHWIETLETLLTRKAGIAPEAVSALADAWDRAARATPHGKPILLRNDPEAGRDAGEV